MDSLQIVQRLHPGARVLRAAPLAGGVSAEVLEVLYQRRDGVCEHVVLRRHRAVPGKPDAEERAVREYALLEALHARGLAVPAPRGFFPPSTLVLGFVHGSTALPPHPEVAFARALASIHAVPTAGLPPLPLFTDPMPALRDWLPALSTHARMRAGCGEFTGTPCLLHGDFWPGNVMWDGGELVAVLDWEDSVLGDPMTDLACGRTELHRYLDVHDVEVFTAAYGERRAIDGARLPWWDLFVSTAALTYMDGWGLAPEELVVRKARTQAWQARALDALGLVR